MIHFEVSLTTMKFVIATCAVCIKIIVIINEKKSVQSVHKVFFFQNSKSHLFSLNQFFHHLILFSSIK